MDTWVLQAVDQGQGESLSSQSIPGLIQANSMMALKCKVHSYKRVESRACSTRRMVCSSRTGSHWQRTSEPTTSMTKVVRIIIPPLTQLAVSSRVETVDAVLLHFVDYPRFRCKSPVNTAWLISPHQSASCGLGLAVLGWHDKPFNLDKC
ncbi:uncharacterized protein B0I36DRAFT_141570 [Microdochium trichocladiopsis]|uniref:Uncharacterized protein n=1 Tax=Microdochium trichocladiopsis TaxID=1682393 RepID=A0A9P8Y1V4_9PEZI|nr:uncharacterized protein B0I36DRAFT_141570 [Microdochium trichocladiopsis]KAH7027660.1 hypothetical protein B0I36DRAFT_141570 [Microdochium trichocladiopsis]